MILKNKNETLSDSMFRWKDEFVKHLTFKEKDELTIENYLNVVDHLIEFTETKKDIKNYDQMNLKFINEYFVWRNTEGNSKAKAAKAGQRIRNIKLESSTKRNDKKVLMIFLEFLEEESSEDFLFNIKWKKIQFKKEVKEKGHHSASTIADYLKYIDSKIKKDRSDFNYTLSLTFKLGLYGGLRATEICTVRFCDFSKPYSSSGKKIVDLKIYGKGNKDLTNPIPYEHIKNEYNYFKRNRLNDEQMFYSKQKKLLNRFHLYRYVEEAARECGLEKGLHVLRHTFGFNLNELGIDLMDIQELLRHADPSTTRIYTKRSKNRMIKAVTKL